MSEKLLVTLADKNYINQAKQLFSSVYFNAGWEGDLMLLTNDISGPDAEWFFKRNIIVRKFDKICDEPIGYLKKSPVLTGKFYLFQEYFKKWKNIVFLDSDIIVRASIDSLSKIKGFAAVKDVDNYSLRAQFINKKLVGDKGKVIYDKLEEEYNLEEQSFNSGVMAFSTDIIKNNSFETIIKLFKKYYLIHQVGDQPTMNLYFYKKWKRLPIVYNIYASRIAISYGKMDPMKLSGIIMHIFGEGNDKPWSSRNPFHGEWSENLNRADSISFNAPVVAKNQWSPLRMHFYSYYLEARKSVYKSLNYFHKLLLSENILYFFRFLGKGVKGVYFKVVGLLGAGIRKAFPGLYSKLKPYFPDR